MPGGYLAPKLLAWPWAEARLSESRNYWISTAAKDGAPHARPVWGVWLEGLLYFSSGSRIRTHLEREPRVSVSRSIFALVDDRDRAYFGRDARDQDQIGYIDANTRAIFGRSYAAEPDVLVKQLAADEAIAAADTLLLTVPNQLGVDYNAHAIESILKFVAPELGWR